MFDDTLGGKRVERTVEDPAASCKEGASRLLDVSSTHLVHDRLGDHPSIQQEEEKGRKQQVSCADVLEEKEKWKLHIYRHSEPGLERRHTY